MKTPPKTRLDRKSDTRKLVIDTAYRVFGEKGLMQCRTINIARAAGVAHGTLFLHFPTKEALLIEVTHEFGSRVIHRSGELGDWAVGVRGVLEAHLQCLKEVEPFYSRLIEEFSQLPIPVRNTFLGIQSAISHRLQIVFEEDCKSGNLKAIPPHLLFNTWIALIHHYLINKNLFSPDESVIERYGRDLIDHYMSLISVN